MSCIRVLPPGLADCCMWKTGLQIMPKCGVGLAAAPPEHGRTSGRALRTMQGIALPHGRSPAAGSFFTHRSRPNVGCRRWRPAKSCRPACGKSRACWCSAWWSCSSACFPPIRCRRLPGPWHRLHLHDSTVASLRGLQRWLCVHPSLSLPSSHCCPHRCPASELAALQRVHMPAAA